MVGPFDADRTLDAEPVDHAARVVPFAAGFTIGHFRIVRELGAGGMGVVFEAYDPDLDRRVAIKVVKGPGASTEAGARLIREAQAMAKLAHPHVVAVHEVGTIEGQVFLVMELVPGETLAAWLEKPHMWREIVGAFVQAGEGLAAAHAAELVHRDFKPTNVLVDHGGRVRVGDFGLAREDDVQLAKGSDRLVAGTPGYMAPEQRVGDPVDARADQYSFAVSLQQALEGVAGVPRRVRAAIARALSIDPDDRYPAMEPLLHELRRAQSTRSRWIAAIAAATVISGGGATAAVLLTRPGTDDCGANLVDGVWKHQLPFTGPAASTTTKIVDDWAASWKLGRTAACKADAKPARIACLDRDLAELRAQLALWNDKAAAEHAVTAAAALPQPAECAGETHATIAGPLQAELAQLHALERSGKTKDAAPLAAKALADAEAAKDPTALAAALLVTGEIERENDQLAQARDHLARAGEEAGKAGNDALLVEALTFQAITAGDQGRPLDALGVADAAKAIAARGHLHAERVGMVHGEALRDAGRLPEAIAELEGVVKALEARRDPGARVELAATLGGLASAYESMRDPKKAIELHRRTLAIEEADYGPDHPEVGRTLHDLANAESRVGDFAGAKQHYERGRAIFVAAYGPTHELVGMSDVSLAGLELTQNHDDAAEQLFAQASNELAGVPEDHPIHQTIEEALGSIARDRDKCKDAIPHFEKAGTIDEHLGRTGPDVGGLLINLGACYADVGRDADARTVLAQAEKLYDDSHVPERDYAELRIIESDLVAKTGDKAKAIALVERVLATTSDDDPNPAVPQLRAYARESLAHWKR
ncbi:MAG: serine/threonine protein kinase [Deltaproteobacteria bacterium]|nr:serine/threonine protein kinase [Deltaproteobacteria bacterium]